MSNLLNTTTAEAAARLVRHDKNMTENGATLTREWSHIDATVADTLKVALDAVASYTNPQADGQIYQGTFISSKAWSVAAFGDPENGERYVNILQSLVKAASVLCEADLFDSSAVVTQENEILAPFDLDLGEEDKIAYAYKHMADSSRLACMGVPDNALLSNLCNEDVAEWVSGKAYVLGSLVEYADRLYVCITAHTAGRWSGDTAKWSIVLRDRAATWATATGYSVGDFVLNAGTSYLCISAHTSGTFATDYAAPRWVVFKRATPTTWATGSAFLVGERVFVEGSSTEYVCLVAHTAGTFATDLANEKWISFSDIGPYSAWASSTAYTTGQIAGRNGTLYVCLIAHTSDTFLTELTNGRWTPFKHAEVTPWTTSTAYTIGNVVDKQGASYVCVSSHTSGTWGTDLANPRWVIWKFATAEAWVTGTSYTTGNTVTSANKTYVCVLGHTASAAFSTDLATKWGQLYRWTYVDRRFAVQEDKTGIFTILFKREQWPNVWANRRQQAQEAPQGVWGKAKTLVARGVSKDVAEAQFAAMTAETGSGWATATAYYTGDVVTETSVTYMCLVSHTSGTWGTDYSTNGYWIVATPILTEKRWSIAASGEFVLTGEQKWSFSGTAESDAVVLERSSSAGSQQAGLRRVWWRRSLAARNTLTASGAAVLNPTTPGAYTHAGYTVSDNGDGTYDVYQVAITPRSRISWEDTESEVVEEATLKAVQIDERVWVPRVVVVYKTIFENAQAAADYADASDEFHDIDSQQAISGGRVQYVGGGKYAGRKVKLHADWLNIATP